MVLPNVYERVKEALQPPEVWKPAREFRQGYFVLVRDYRPNSTCKGVVRSLAGILNYDVEIEGGNCRKVHIDHQMRDTLALHVSNVVPPQPLAMPGNISTQIESDNHDTILLEGNLPTNGVGTENSLSPPQMENEAPLGTESAVTQVREQLEPVVQPSIQQPAAQIEALQSV